MKTIISLNREKGTPVWLPDATALLKPMCEGLKYIRSEDGSAKDPDDVDPTFALYTCSEFYVSSGKTMISPVKQAEKLNAFLVNCGVDLFVKLGKGGKLYVGFTDDIDLLDEPEFSR